MSRIFISYRRDDSGMAAGRIYDHLSARFGEAQVFLDVGTIEPGEDFVDKIEQAVSSCQVLVAVIGKIWLNILGADGTRRLDSPQDFVRI